MSDSASNSVCTNRKRPRDVTLKAMNKKLRRIDLQTQSILTDENNHRCREIASLTHILNFTRFMKLKDDVALDCSRIRVVLDFDDSDGMSSVNQTSIVEIKSSRGFFTYEKLIEKICDADRRLRIAFSKNLPSKKYDCHIENTVLRGLKQRGDFYVIQWGS